MTALREHLQARVDAFTKLRQPGATLIERFVLHAGVECAGSAPPWGIDPGRPKLCFENATKLVWADSTLTYCEGFVLREDLPLAVLHAWALDRDGRVIDNTLRDAETCLYFGVRFTRTQLDDELRRNKVYGLLDTGRGVNVRLIQSIAPSLVKEMQA